VIIEHKRLKYGHRFADSGMIEGSPGTIEESSEDSAKPPEVEVSAAVTHEGECPTCRTWIAVRSPGKADMLWIQCPTCRLTMGLEPHARPQIALK
jgi:hypothetical protein